VSRLTPSWWAFTAVAPIVRFNAFDILVTPVFFFASDFNSRTSDDVQARRTIFLVAIYVPFLTERRSITTFLIINTPFFDAGNNMPTVKQKAALTCRNMTLA
jgi:hypothetical protein